jgi:hypothetical protein
MRRIYLPPTGDGAFFISLSLNEKARLRGAIGLLKAFSVSTLANGGPGNRANTTAK